MNMLKQANIIRFVAILLLLVSCSPNNAKLLPSETTCSQSSPCNVIHGNALNRVSDQVIGATIAGGGSVTFPNLILADHGVIGGGLGNQASGQSVIGGGSMNVAGGFRTAILGGSNNTTSSASSSIGGGSLNTALGARSTISGGINNQALGLDATIGGGSGNIAEGRAATISGGTRNTVRNFATVGGGLGNGADGGYSTVAGGVNNVANAANSAICGGAGNQVFGLNALIGGGLGNSALGDYATIGGGHTNTIGSLMNDSRSGNYATVSGGLDNIATGTAAVIPGGDGNHANGDYSLAAGHNAVVLAEHGGTFIFADSSSETFTSQSPNEFAIRATGGARIVTAIDDNGDPISGVILPGGSGAWSFLSTRASKADIKLVNEHDVLERLTKLPVYYWRYSTQDPSVLHMGPIAEDFSAAFGLGENDQYISPVDSIGVSLAAIRAMNDSVLAQQGRIERLEQQNEEMRIRLAALEHNDMTQSNNSRLSKQWITISWGLTGLLGGMLLMVFIHSKLQPSLPGNIKMGKQITLR